VKFTCVATQSKKNKLLLQSGTSGLNSFYFNEFKNFNILNINWNTPNTFKFYIDTDFVQRESIGIISFNENNNIPVDIFVFNFGKFSFKFLVLNYYKIKYNFMNL